MLLITEKFESSYANGMLHFGCLKIKEKSLILLLQMSFKLFFVLRASFQYSYQTPDLDFLTVHEIQRQFYNFYFQRKW